MLYIVYLKTVTVSYTLIVLGGKALSQKKNVFGVPTLMLAAYTSSAGLTLGVGSSSFLSLSLVKFPPMSGSWLLLPGPRLVGLSKEMKLGF